MGTWLLWMPLCCARQVLLDDDDGAQCDAAEAVVVVVAQDLLPLVVPVLVSKVKLVKHTCKAVQIHVLLFVCHKKGIRSNCNKIMFFNGNV